MKKITSTLILLFVITSGIKAQFNCHMTYTCGGFNQTDNQKINNTLLNIYSATSSGGPRQSTLDSIKNALYSPLGHSPLTAANYLQSINVASNNLPFINYYDSLIADLQAQQKIFNDVFLTNNIGSIQGSSIDTRNAVQYMQGQLANDSGNNSVFDDDATGRSVFYPHLGYGRSYFINIALSDTLIQSSTSMSDLVGKVNTFYAEHPVRQIKDVSYTNAVITATLTFFAVIRYID